MKLLKDRLVVYQSIHVESGRESIDVIDKTILEETLKKLLKEGWIPKKLFDENTADIVRWGMLKEIINENKGEIKELKEQIEGTERDIESLKNMPAYKNRIPIMADCVKRDKIELDKCEKLIRKTKDEFKLLNDKVRNFKDYDFVKKIGYI